METMKDYQKLCLLNKTYERYMFYIEVHHDILKSENVILYRVYFANFEKQDSSYKDFSTVDECEKFIKIKLSDTNYRRKCLRYKEN